MDTPLLPRLGRPLIGVESVYPHVIHSLSVHSVDPIVIDTARPFALARVGLARPGPVVSIDLGSRAIIGFHTGLVKPFLNSAAKDGDAIAPAFYSLPGGPVNGFWYLIGFVFAAIPIRLPPRAFSCETIEPPG